MEIKIKKRRLSKEKTMGSGYARAYINSMCTLAAGRTEGRGVYCGS
jgi:hypothetical protein